MAPPPGALDLLGEALVDQVAVVEQPRPEVPDRLVAQPPHVVGLAQDPLDLEDRLLDGEGPAGEAVEGPEPRLERGEGGEGGVGLEDEEEGDPGGPRLREGQAAHPDPPGLLRLALRVEEGGEDEDRRPLLPDRG